MPTVDSRATAPVVSQSRGRGALPTPTPTVAAAAREGERTPAQGTASAVTQSTEREPTPRARLLETPDVKPQGTREGTPTGTSAVALPLPPDVEPERTATAESQPAREFVLKVHADTFRSSLPAGCSFGGGTGVWLFRQFVAWSPSGSEVFFTQGGAVYAAASDGARVRQVVGERATKSEHLEVTLDIREYQDGTRVRVVRDTLSTRPVEQGAGDNLGTVAALSMSADGRRLLHSTCAYPRQAAVAEGRLPEVSDFQYDLAIVDVTDGVARRLTISDTAENFPAWSPDGARIAYLSTDLRVYTMAPDGSDVHPVSGELVLVFQQTPQWAPDGQRLAFVAKEPPASLPALYTVRADGTELRRLTAAVSPPSWSSDGRRLAVAQPSGDEQVTLVTLAANGTDVRTVTSIKGWEWTTGRQGTRLNESKGRPDFRAAEAWIETLAWSPADDQILYTCGTGFCVSATDGTLVGMSPRDADETKDEEEIRRYAVGPRPAAAWSPDGSRIAVVGNPWSDDAGSWSLWRLTGPTSRSWWCRATVRSPWRRAAGTWT